MQTPRLVFSLGKSMIQPQTLSAILSQRVGACQFVGLEVGKADEGGPDDDGIFSGVGTAAAGEIEVVAPTVFSEFAGLVMVEPVEASFRLLKIFEFRRWFYSELSNHEPCIPCPWSSLWV